jgi:hypothetical protein
VSETARTLAEAVKEYQGRLRDRAAQPMPLEPSASGLVAGLIKDFGLGAEPALRRRLYERLQRLVSLHGQQVEILIAEKRSLALDPHTVRPGNYFAKAITTALRERGLV